MASTSRASRKRVEDAEIFQMLEGGKKGNSATRTSTREISFSAIYRKFLGKIASYLFRQFFQLHKSYGNAIGIRTVQLW